MNDDSGTIVWIAIIGLTLWMSVGGGWTTVKGWFGQDTYPDQVAALEQFAKDRRIGSSADVWLTKLNYFGESEKVSLFFGYWDDWEACYEFAEMYMQRYPDAQYACRLAN